MVATPHTRTFATPAPIELRLDLALGSVHLIASDRDDTTVSIVATDPERDVDVRAAAETEMDLDTSWDPWRPRDSDGARLEIAVPRPRGVSNIVARAHHYPSVDVVVELPTGSDVDITAAMAQIRTDGTLGDARVKNAVGDIRVDRAKTAKLVTKGGDLRVDHVDGEAELTAAGSVEAHHLGATSRIRNLVGDTWVGDADGDLAVRASSGDITIERAHGDVNAVTASGAVRLGEVVAGAVELRSGAGDLAIGVPKGTSAWVDAQSRFGRVTSDLEQTGTPADDESVVHINARTGYGHIEVRRP